MARHRKTTESLLPVFQGDKDVGLGPLFSGVDTIHAFIPLVVGKESGTDRAISLDLEDASHLTISYRDLNSLQRLINAVSGSILLHRSPYRLKIVVMNSTDLDTSGLDGGPHLIDPEAYALSAETLFPRLLSIARDRRAFFKLFGARTVKTMSRLHPVEDIEGLEPSSHLVVIVPELSHCLDQRTLTDFQLLLNDARACGIHLVLASRGLDSCLPLSDANVIPAKIVLDQPQAGAVSLQMFSAQPQTGTLPEVTVERLRMLTAHIIAEYGQQ